MRPQRIIAFAGLAGALALVDLARAPEHGTAIAAQVPTRETVAFAHLDRAEANARCEGCHPVHAQEWRASLHRASFEDAAFQRSLAREPLPFCRGCHAPEADPESPPPAWAAAIGVGCVTCHLQEGDVLAAPRSEADDGAIPHAVVRTAALADERACAGCHEFEFPRSRWRPAGTLMQSTVQEHAASPHAEASCADCHMPTAADGHVDHGFAITRRPDRLRAALHVESERVGPSTLQLRLEPVDVGHAFPTGDLNRRLVIEAAAVDADGTSIATARRELARHHPPPPVGATHMLRAATTTPDDRLVGPTTIELALPDARASDRIEWRVVYERVDHRDPFDPAASTLFAAIELAAGSV